MMKPTDQQQKWRVVLLVMAFAVIGFVLEIGPVGGVFSLVNNGPPIFTALQLELAAFGLLAYFSLPAAAVIGLHVQEEEPTDKKRQEAEGDIKSEDGGGIIEKVRVRPELHQLRMLVTALCGYALFKVISLVLLANMVEPYGLSAGKLAQLFHFGFGYIALGWFALWQFLRWHAQRQGWIRLQDELIGGDLSRFLAFLLLLTPLVFMVTAGVKGTIFQGPFALLTLLIHLTVAAAAVILWFTRPYTLRKTIIGLLGCGVLMIMLTIVLAVVEQIALS